MEIQKAEEFVALIAKEGCYFNSSGDFNLSTNMTAPLILARDKAIIERCKAVVHSLAYREDGDKIIDDCDIDFRIDSILRELEGGA